MSARYITVAGKDHPIERIEHETTDRLRLVFAGTPPELRDRTIYLLTDGANREPVRSGWVECEREVIVATIY